MSPFIADAGSSTRASAADVSTFLKRLRPEARNGFLSVRAVVVSLGPDVGEKLESNAMLYTRRDHPFLEIRGGRTQVNVLFPPDIHVDDPMGRLLKRGDERYLAIDASGDLDGHVEEFLRKAYAAAR